MSRVATTGRISARAKPTRRPPADSGSRLKLPTDRGPRDQRRGGHHGESAGEDAARGARFQSEDRPARVRRAVRSDDRFRARSGTARCRSRCMSRPRSLRIWSAMRTASPNLRSTSQSPGRAIPPKAFRCRCAQSPSKQISGSELYRLDGLTVTTTWKGDGFPAAGVPVTLQARRTAARIWRRRRWSSTGLDCRCGRRAPERRAHRARRFSMRRASAARSSSIRCRCASGCRSSASTLPQTTRSEGVQAAELREQRGTDRNPPPKLGDIVLQLDDTTRERHARHRRFRLEGAALRSERRSHQRRSLSAAAERRSRPPKAATRSRRRRFRSRRCAS